MPYVGAKYAALTHYLKSSGKDTVSMTTDELGIIIPLPPWVLDPNRAPWANTKQSFAAGWRNAGYLCLGKQGNIVTFIIEK